MLRSSASLVWGFVRAQSDEHEWNWMNLGMAPLGLCRGVCVRIRNGVRKDVRDVTGSHLYMCARPHSGSIVLAAFWRFRQESSSGDKSEVFWVKLPKFGKMDLWVQGSLCSVDDKIDRKDLWIGRNRRSWTANVRRFLDDKLHRKNFSIDSEIECIRRRSEDRATDTQLSE